MIKDTEDEIIGRSSVDHAIYLQEMLTQQILSMNLEGCYEAFMKYFAVLSKVKIRIHNNQDWRHTLPPYLAHNMLIIDVFDSSLENEPLDVFIAAWMTWNNTDNGSHFSSKVGLVTRLLISFYNNAGWQLITENRHTEAVDHYFERGINHAKNFLLSNESIEVAGEALSLYAGAGYALQYINRHQEAIEGYYNPGIHHALELRKNHPDNPVVNRYILRLYSGVGRALTIKKKFKEAHETYLKEGISLSKELYAIHPNDKFVTHNIMSLHMWAGDSLKSQGKHEEATTRYYLPGIKLGKELMDKNIPSAMILRLYKQAAMSIRSINSMREEEALEQYIKPGCDCIKKLPLRFLNDVDVNRWSFDLLIDLCQSLLAKGNVVASLPHIFFVNWLARNERTKKQYHREIDPQWKSNIHSELNRVNTLLKGQLSPWRSVVENEVRDIIDPVESLKAFHYFLEELVLYWCDIDNINVTFPSLETLTCVAESLLILDLRQRHEPLEAAFRMTEELDERLFKFASLSAQDPNHGVLGNWLKQRLFRKTQTQRELLLQISPDIEATLDHQAHWLAAEILNLPEMPSLKRGSETLMLAMLLNNQACNPVATVEKWCVAPPWLDEKKLREAMKNVVHPIQKNIWSETGESSKQSQQKDAAGSTSMNPLTEDNKLEEASSKSTQTESISSSLYHVLTKAFSRVYQLSIPLARSLAAFVDGTPEKLWELISEDKNKLTLSVQKQRPLAIASIILGNAEDVLSTAITNWINNIYPVDVNGSVEDIRRQIKRRFSRLISIHPGMLIHGRLAQKLHSLCQKQLDFEMCLGAPSLQNIWSILERSRIALNNFKTAPLEKNWKEKIGNKLLTTLANLSIDKGIEGEWSLPSLWLSWMKEENILFHVKTPTECRESLTDGEEIIQFFFAPSNGKLYALCLVHDMDKSHASESHNNSTAQKNIGMELHIVPGVVLQNFDEVLSQWAKWINNLPPKPKDNTWEVVMGSEPVITIARWLKIRSKSSQKIVVIFPAPLSQIPWEALDIIPEGAIERAVSLNSWRMKEMIKKGGEQKGVFFDQSPESNIKFGVQEAIQAADFLDTDHMEFQATTFDLINGLKNLNASHLIFHGKYEPFAPLNSAILIGRDEKFPIWTLSIIQPKVSYLGVSACEVNLSGDTTKGLLGTVGVGPALIAAGVRTSIGPVFAVDQLANWIFYHELYQEAKMNGIDSWPILVATARQKLRAYTKDGLIKFVKEHLQPLEIHNSKFKSKLSTTKTFRDIQHDSIFQRDRPFDNPFYWSPYIVLGETDRC